MLASYIVRRIILTASGITLMTEERALSDLAEVVACSFYLLNLGPGWQQPEIIQIIGLLITRQNKAE